MANEKQKNGKKVKPKKTSQLKAAARKTTARRTAGRPSSKGSKRPKRMKAAAPKVPAKAPEGQEAVYPKGYSVLISPDIASLTSASPPVGYSLSYTHDPHHPFIDPLLAAELRRRKAARAAAASQNANTPSNPPQPGPTNGAAAIGGTPRAGTQSSQPGKHFDDAHLKEIIAIWMGHHPHLDETQHFSHRPEGLFIKANPSSDQENVKITSDRISIRGNDAPPNTMMAMVKTSALNFGDINTGECRVTLEGTQEFKDHYRAMALLFMQQTPGLKFVVDGVELVAPPTAPSSTNTTANPTAPPSP